MRRLLTDTSRCPSCAAHLPGDHCPACGVDLSSQDGGQVWQLSVRAAQTLAEREVVLTRMRELARRAVVPSASAQGPVPPPVLPPMPLPMSPPAPPVPPQGWQQPVPKPVSGLGVHGLLVGIGALLLAVAAVGFLVFSWRGLPLAGRALVIGGATVGVLSVASWLRARLPQTAEAVGALGVVLVLSDCWAIRRTGLFGADRPEALGYAAVAIACASLLLGGWALVSKVRAGSISAVVLLPLAVVLLAARLDGDLAGFPVLAAGFLLAAALTLGRTALPPDWLAERLVLRGTATAALLAAALPACFGTPGPRWAALILLGVAGCAAGQTFADQRVADRPRRAVPALTSTFLRRGWSLAAGLSAGMAALQAGIALADVAGVDDVRLLIPVTIVPAVAVVLAAILPVRSGVVFRRAAFSAGVAVAAIIAAVPVLLLACWLPVRAASGAVATWQATAGTRLADLGPAGDSDLASWFVPLIGLMVVVGCGWSAVRLGGWPGWLTRPLVLVAWVGAGLVVLVLPLVPTAPVAAVVAGLAAISVVFALLIAVLPDIWRARGGRTVTCWVVGAGSGTLAVVLGWSVRELSVPVTVAGIAGLLLARRRAPSANPAIGVALAGLAALATPFAVAGGADLLGAPGQLRLVWAGLAGGLTAAALIGLPRWLPTARPGRAVWTGADRLAAAVPGVLALVIGLFSTLLTLSDSSDLLPTVTLSLWPRPVLLAVALVVALTAGCALRPQVGSVIPALPSVGSVLAAPILGLLLDSVRPALSPSITAALPSSLIWAVTAAVGALLITAFVLADRAEPDRRIAAEVGIAVCAVVALSRVDGADSLWPVLLVLGAAAAAISIAADRRQVGWLSGVLLTGSTWTRLAEANVHLVEAYSLPPAAALLALAGYRLWRQPDADPVKLLTPVGAIAFGPSVLAAASGPGLRPALLIATAAILVVAGLELRLRGTWPRLVVLLTSTGSVLAGVSALVRSGSEWTDPALASIEAWTIPAALVVLLAGLRLMNPGRTSGPARSWLAYGPGLLLLLMPSLIAGIAPDHGPQARQFVLIGLAAATLAAGAWRRLQAAVALGAVVLCVQALILLTPWITELPTTIPIWGWLGAVGLGLLLLGARYERGLRRLRRMRLRLAALR